MEAKESGDALKATKADRGAKVDQAVRATATAAGTRTAAARKVVERDNNPTRGGAAKPF